MPYPMTLYAIHDMELQTDRLILRQWLSSDLPVFAQINSSKLAMEHFPNQLSRSASDDLAARLVNEIATCGWGMWAVELKSTSTFIGFVGLSTPLTQFPFSPCVEIGWRLHPDNWGYGFATEAAEMALEFAFTFLELKEVVAMTATTNHRSEAVMQRLGLKNTKDNFFHPNVSLDSRVSEHLLYKITQAEWRNPNG